MAPPPVSFLLSIGTFPVNYSATPQQFAIDLVNRLTVTPSAPWNSFQVNTTTAIGSITNVGPVLYDNSNGAEWQVYNRSTGQYTVLTVEGSGLVNNSVPLSALATQTPGGLLSYNASGAPTVIAPAVSGTGFVLTQQGSGLFAPTAPPNAPGSSYFETFPSTSSQSIPFTSGGGSNTTLAFNTVRFDSTSTFNTTGNYFTVPANQVWFLYACCQLDWTGATSGNLLQVVIELAGSSTVGTLYNYSAPLGRAGAYTSAIITPGASPQNVTVVINATGSGSGAVAMLSNSANNRFGGFRLF